MKHLVLLGIFACGLQSAIAQSVAPVHHKHHKKNYTAHNATTPMHQQHNIKVSENGNENDDHNVYEGKPSRSNDGAKKNDHRNLNYNNTNANLAPSNGGNMK
jgi:hypothetical protein